MAISKKSLANLKPQKKGEPGRNPHGTNNVALREVRRLTREQISDIGSVLLRGDEEALDRYCDDANVPMIKKLLANVARRATNRGDHKAMIALLETVAGKQIQEVKVQMSAHAALVQMLGEAPDEDEEEFEVDDDFLNEGK